MYPASLNTQSWIKGLWVVGDFCFWAVWASGPVKYSFSEKATKIWKILDPENMKNLPSNVAHNLPQFFFIYWPAVQTAQKQKSRTTKSPLIQDWVFRLGEHPVLVFRVLTCIHMCHKVMYKWHPCDDKGSKVGVTGWPIQNGIWLFFFSFLLQPLIRAENLYSRCK